MISREKDEQSLTIHYRSYRLALMLLLLPPLMLIEHLPALLQGTIDASNLAALALGVLVPLLAAYLLIELASFRFIKNDNIFRWRWRNLLRREALDLPLDRVVSVRREVAESTDAEARSRLVVVLDDDSIIGLTRGYSGYQDRELDRMIDEIREYLGHVVPMR